MKKQDKAPKRTTTKARVRVQHPSQSEVSAPEEVTSGDPLGAALGVAALLASPYPEEAAAIDNVIRFVEDVRAGLPARVKHEDLLLALSILLTATEQQITAEARSLLAMMDGMLGVPGRSFAACSPQCPMHCHRQGAPRPRAPVASRAASPPPSSFTSAPSFVPLTRLAA